MMKKEIRKILDKDIITANRSNDLIVLDICNVVIAELNKLPVKAVSRSLNAITFKLSDWEKLLKSLEFKED